MDFSVINLELVGTLLLLLLVGIGPKIALVPFLDKTKSLTVEQQREVGRLMVKTAIIAALIVFASGALLLKLLHITPPAVAIAGGIILGLLAVKMALGPGEEVVDEGDIPHDHTKMAVFPLAVPYLLNPVGVTVLIIASAQADGFLQSMLVVVLVLVVGALDWVIFTNVDKIAKRLNPSSLVISEVVFGILLTAVAVQLVVSGLNGFGIIDTGGHH